MRCVVVFLAGILISKNVIAMENVKFNLAATYIYTKINDPVYQEVNPDNVINNEKNYSNLLFYGVNYKINNFIISLNTNRLSNTRITQQVIRRKDGVLFDNKVKTDLDILRITYKKNNFGISTSLIDTIIDKQLYYSNNLVGQEKQETINAAFDLSYFFNNNFNISAIFVLPNDKIFLERGFGVSVKYTF